MPSLEQLAVFLPAAVLVAVSPGANNLLALRNGLHQGAGDAIAALSGRVAAFTVMVGLVVAGLGSVLTRSQMAFEAIKWAGVAYLVYLGVRGLVDGRAESTHDPERPAPSARRTRVGLARQEFLVAAANPKALLLFVAFIPQFVDPVQPALPQLLVLAPIYIAIEFLAACGWAAAGGRIRSSGVSARVRSRLNRATGGVFIGLAAWLAASER